MATTEVTGIPDKFYYTAVPRSRAWELFKQTRALGVQMEDELPPTSAFPTS
ncbi:hypothetical protein [Spongiactinospora sp. 9N601]|uniref:hypothetical protein n=1 Tax=Spongiactinospora sp. 9N601 TaxID=3375149 RepID=UPI0037A5A33D